MIDRSPYDGRPYYCRECGCGYAEFLACEDGWCELEDFTVAEMRQRALKKRSMREKKDLTT